MSTAAAGAAAGVWAIKNSPGKGRGEFFRKEWVSRVVALATPST